MCSPGSYKSNGVVSMEFREGVELICWTEGKVCFQTQFPHGANLSEKVGSMLLLDLDIMR
jgi:hypothetical protein